SAEMARDAADADLGEILRWIGARIGLGGMAAAAERERLDRESSLVDRIGVSRSVKRRAPLAGDIGVAALAGGVLPCGAEARARRRAGERERWVRRGAGHRDQRRRRTKGVRARDAGRSRARFVPEAAAGGSERGVDGRVEAEQGEQPQRFYPQGAGLGT